MMQAAANYRSLRAKRVTVPKTIDVLIGSFCLANRLALLHADADFDWLAEHLGLQVFVPTLSTLHIWWARRPLAACRAVICAALWPDPADELCPAAFRGVVLQTERGPLEPA